MALQRRRLAIAGFAMTLLGMAVVEVGLWLFFLPTSISQRAIVLGVGAAMITVGVSGMALSRSRHSATK